MRWFTRPVFIFSRLKNTPLKDAVGREGKSKRMLSFLFVDKGRLLLQICPSRNLKFAKFSTRPIEALGPFGNATKPGSSQVFEEFSRIYLSIAKKITFLKGNLCICKYFILGPVYMEGGPRSSGVGFFCFHAQGDTKQKKPTPLDWCPPLHVNRVLDFSYIVRSDLSALMGN